MLDYSTATSDYTNLDFPRITVLENRVADRLCSLFPNRFRKEHFNSIQVMLRYLAANTTLPEEPNES